MGETKIKCLICCVSLSTFIYNNLFFCLSILSTKEEWVLKSHETGVKMHHLNSLWIHFPVSDQTGLITDSQQAS